MTLPEVLRDRVERDSDRVMFDFGERSFTYREVHARAETWQLILSDAGAEPGSRIEFLSANRPEFVFALGRLEPEGWLHFTDRLKEMVKVRGFQVAPAEIEAVLHGDARITDCAVFGVPDPELGEAVVAAVVVAPGEAVAAEELQELVASRLAGYKRVRHVWFVDAIPRLPSGKALRRTLKEQWLADRP